MTELTTIIDLRDGEDFDNRRKVINLLSDSKEFIWIANWHFEAKHLEILSASLKENPNINEMRLLLNAPRSIDDLNDLKTNLKLFQKQFNKTSIKIKLITNNKIKKTIHDRFYYTKDQAWNFIELDSLLRGQRATISLLKPDEFDKNVNLDFLKRWDDEETFDIFNHWDKLLDIVKKRQEELEKKHNKIKNNSKVENKSKNKTMFSIYKNNKGIHIDNDTKPPIELNDAITELRNLDINDTNDKENFQYVGFNNRSTNESLQFINNDNKRWYAEIPILVENDWDGYSFKVHATLDEMIKTLESFFKEEPFKELLPWKITRLKYWKSDEQKEENEKKQQEGFSDLR
jgi:hypothetical protein